MRQVVSTLQAASSGERRGNVSAICVDLSATAALTAAEEISNHEVTGHCRGLRRHGARRTLDGRHVLGAGIGALAGAIIGNNVGDGDAATGALIGGAIGGATGAIRGSARDRANQQQYRDNRGRYYYCYDNRRDECYSENGQRRPR